MKNKGNYIVSLSRVAAWLGGIAEVAQFLLFLSRCGRRAGRKVRSACDVVAHDTGLTRQRTEGRRFDLGVAFRARATLLAEGAHGSLSRQAVAMYDLRHGKATQSYEIGIQEVWCVEEGKYVPGKVHTLGRAHQGQLGVPYTTWLTASSALASSSGWTTRFRTSSCIVGSGARCVLHLSSSCSLLILLPLRHLFTLSFLLPSFLLPFLLFLIKPNTLSLMPASLFLVLRTKHHPLPRPPRGRHPPRVRRTRAHRRRARVFAATRLSGLGRWLGEFRILRSLIFRCMI
ncbi:hypothetical protein K438DRAFT_222935 [Mycena galopus ATCC 62051]|nr:hypothetical protein K438DRAFT_222935 [Mycena galopus ATCC 62051]